MRETGLKYILEVKQGDEGSPVELQHTLDSWAAAESGRTNHLGDLRSKQIPEKGGNEKP
jgi:hypothetical protein